MKYFKLIKDIHLHTGLFISPFIIVFSISALILNHNFIDWQEDWQEWYFSVDDKVDKTVRFNLPAPDKKEIDFAKDIIKQINISGEIANVFRDSIRMYIPVTKPGYRISIKADLISGTAYIHSKQTNLWKKLNWLHKMPGPHNANIRGNWIFTKSWNYLVDFSVILLFLSSITGIILWYYLKNERNIGLIALFIGFLSVASLVIGLTI
ncbi:MAG: hypothetical protein GXO83_01875 [Chlorobi bacterium]|nr:hypothetical protein [Chlorobiota bacterium]